MRKIIIFIAVLWLLSGCATIPVADNLPVYSINGINYLPLIDYCDLRGLSWEYDVFTRNIVLSKDSHRINLKVGDALALIDGRAQYMHYPLELYQGKVILPLRFKEEVLDGLFKKITAPGRYLASYPPKIKRVVIDAGHGGKDPGAIGRTGLREKTVILDISRRLSKLLKEEGISVMMTRSSDTFVPLYRRVAIANNFKADLFISIHANANRVRSLNGFEVYYVAPSVSDSERALSAAEDKILNLSSSSFAGSSLGLKAALWDMIYTYCRSESIELGRSLCRSFSRNLNAPILGVKGGRLFVLKGATMPAVLVEVGFLSNSQEERFLSNNYYRQKIAESMREGILDYARGLALCQANN